MAATSLCACKSKCRQGTTLRDGLCVTMSASSAGMSSATDSLDSPGDRTAASEQTEAVNNSSDAAAPDGAHSADAAHPADAGTVTPAQSGASGNAPPPSAGVSNAGCMPVAEVCDGIDNDCDGEVDEQVALKCWADLDDDGFAAASATSVQSCDACGSGQTPIEPNGPETIDCDDSDETTSPSATDICGDNIDNDCDGTPDDEANNACDGPCTEQLPGKPGDACSNGLSGACARMGTYECQPDRSLKCSAAVAMGTPEVCGDNSDNDCDGVVDNGCVMNECGGWDRLSPAPGTPCSMGSGSCRATGSYECSGTDETACRVQPKTPNACGGCTPLRNLGDRCSASCSPDGQYVCDGTDATRCSVTARPMNGCGGCDVLANERNRPCTGECNARGTYTCVPGRTDQTECTISTPSPRNSCGGCARDPSGVASGDYCAAGMNSCATIGTYQCTGAGDSAVLACSARPQSPTNGCGGCVGPAKGTSCIATDSSGNSVDGIYVCDGELTFCEPRT